MTPDASPPQALSETLRVLTRRRLIRLAGILRRYIRKHHVPVHRTPHRVERAGLPPVKGRYQRWLPILQLIPWFLGAGFIGSFFWDFSGMRLHMMGMTVQIEGLLRMVSVSGLIGFLTNWLALTMLFRPRKPRPMLGQGLIPAQKERVIHRLAEAISRELINEEIIRRRIEESGILQQYRRQLVAVGRGVLEDEAFRQELRMWMRDFLQDVVGREHVRRELVQQALVQLEKQADGSLERMMLRMYRLFGRERLARRVDRVVQDLPAQLEHMLDRIDRALDELPVRMEAYADELEALTIRLMRGFIERLDVYGMLLDNMERYDEQQLENLLKHTSNEQFNYIKYLGGVLGALGGLVIWQPVLALSVFLVLGLGVYGLDSWLYHRYARASGADG